MRSDHISTGRISRDNLLEQVRLEMDRAMRKNGAFASAHEAYAVLLEEVDELWEEVRKKRANRSAKHMREECIQIAASAIRFAMDICRENNGTVKATVR